MLKQQSVKVKRSQQSIRLQIDLPFDSMEQQEPMDDYLDLNDEQSFSGKLSSVSNGNQTPTTIHLRINIERSGGVRKRPTTLAAKCGSVTSGYSSSSDLDEIDYERLNDRAFCHSDQSFASSCAAENLYDKLNYPSTAYKTRLVEKRPSTSRSAPTYVNELHESDNIYEEISSFLELNGKQSNRNNYQNLNNYSTTTTNKRVSKREYTINEIFDNLKKFKKQAKEQEHEVNTNYTNVLMTTRPRQMCPQPHVYVNEPIVKPTFV